MEMLDIIIRSTQNEGVVDVADQFCSEHSELFVAKLNTAEDAKVTGAFLFQKDLSRPCSFRLWDTYCSGFEDLAERMRTISYVEVIVCYFVLSSPSKQFCQLILSKEGMERLLIALIIEPECQWNLNFQPVPVEFFDQVVVGHEQTEAELGRLISTLT